MFYHLLDREKIYTIITRLKAHALIPNWTTLRLKLTMKDSILMGETFYIHADNMDIAISNIKTFIICLNY